MTEKVRTQNQDDWKRSQIRIPQGLYDDVVKYAESRDISLNTAMITLMDKGLIHSTPSVGLPPYKSKPLESCALISQETIDKIADQVADRLKKAP